MTAALLVGLVLAGIAAVLHVGFFVLESVLFRGPTGRRVFGVRPENDSPQLRLFAVNQGVYNLALALAMLVGIVLVVGHPSPTLGIAVIVAVGAVMVVAGFALALTAPRRMLPIAAAQGVLPLLAIIAVLAG